MLPRLRLDLVAGLTAAAVVLPKAMAYATVAGLPVAVGLYTAFVPMVVYALLGTSRVLSVSSTATLAILAGTQLGLAVPDGDPARLLVAAATLSALTGAILILASALRLGFVANFISTPVLTGFKAGIGLVIVLDQVPKLLGLHIDKQGFFRDLLSLIQALPETSLITLGLAVLTLVLLATMERLRPHSPAPLIAVGGGIALSWLFGLEHLGVSTVGLIPQGLPSLTLPDPALVQQLLPGAFGIALMSFTETIAAGRAFAAPGEPPIKPNRELLATGSRQPGRCPARRDAGRRRNLADRRGACGGRSFASRLAGHGWGGRRHHAGAGPDARFAAERGAGGGGHRLFDRTHPARRVPGHSPGQKHGVPVGAGRVRRGAGVRHPQGHRRRHRALADRSRQSGGAPGRACHRTQAWRGRAATRSRPSIQTTRPSPVS